MRGPAELCREQREQTRRAITIVAQRARSRLTGRGGVNPEEPPASALAKAVVDPRPDEGSEERRQEGEGRREDDCHDNDHAQGHGLEDDDGREEDGRERENDYDAGEEDGSLPEVSPAAVTASGTVRLFSGSSPEPRHDEERIVDADADPDHHREVRHPDGKRDDVASQYSRPKGRSEPEHRQQGAAGSWRRGIRRRGSARSSRAARPSAHPFSIDSLLTRLKSAHIAA